jgi:hypothetical protein
VRWDSVVELKALERERLGEGERLGDLLMLGGLLSRGERLARASSGSVNLAPPPVQRLARGAAFALAPRWSRSRPATRPKLALGIAPGPHPEDYLLAVRVQDPALLGSAFVEGICQRAHGEVDVRFIGRGLPLGKPQLRAGWQRAACRPLVPGASIGARHGRTTGTLGGFVRSRRDGSVALLSNSHILADNGRSQPGAGIVQPGWRDGGRDPAHRVAHLAASIRLHRHVTNELDCAIAILDGSLAWDPEEFRGGPLAAVAEPRANERVAKIGRTTEYTEGHVAAIDTGPVTFHYPIGDIVFDGLVEVHGVATGPFARNGDSGSVVFEPASRCAVGLLFGITTSGGSNGAGITYVHPLPAVLERLQIDLVT